MINNISGLKYSVENSFSMMEDVLNKYKVGEIYDPNDNNDEMFFFIGTCLHWIMDCLDRIENDIKYEEKEVKLVSAFRGANNLLKHNKSIIHLHTVEGGMTFPIVFPLDIPLKHHTWQRVNESEIGSKYLSQTKNYNELLCDKDIEQTMKEAIKIIDKYLI